MDEAPYVSWQKLTHAYGAAEDVPVLLSHAESDARGGHVPGSTWHNLWSALCHQGDTYTASYAAVPFLVKLAELPVYQHNCEPLHLAASIELSRMEGFGPEMPSQLVVTYRNAISAARAIAEQLLSRAESGSDDWRILRGCVAAFYGQSLTARSIFDE